MKNLLIVIATLVLCALGAYAPSSARANVTIQGHVYYYDTVRNMEKPAKRVLVEARGNWWFASNPVTHTDNNGYYSMTQRNPYIGTFDINIRGSAETAGLIGVREAIWWWYSYRVDSNTAFGIGANSTASIDLHISGPSNNVVSTGYRSIRENANAFLVHQEILDHYESLKAKGLPDSAFNGTNVIVPSAGANSYYNHFTGNINLVFSDALGMASWDNFSSTQDGAYNNQNFQLVTVRHESSHAVHSKITDGWVWGLNYPANHSLETQSNTWLGLTEAFAEFLPLTSLGISGIFDGVPSQFETSLNLPTNIPPTDHTDWEGEVASMFWDIYGPSGQEKHVRHPATTGQGGEPVPSYIQARQTWVDRIADSNLARIRMALTAHNSSGDCIQTPGEFIQAFCNLYPSDLHAMKTIAYNRQLLTGSPVENAARADSISLNRENQDDVVIAYTLVEPDAEDRQNVGVSFYRECPTGVLTTAFPTTVTSSGWSGDRANVSFRFRLVDRTEPSDRLWLVVNDEMAPRAYVLAIPKYIPPTKFTKYPVKPISLKDILMRESVQTAKRLPILGSKWHDIPASGLKISPPPDSVALRAQSMKDALALRGIIEEARQEIRKYFEHKELVAKQDSALYAIARTAGARKLPQTVPKLLREPRPLALSVKSKIPDAEKPVLDAYELWLDQTVEGMLPDKALTADAMAALKENQSIIDRALADTTRPERLLSLQQKLADALGKVTVLEKRSPEADDCRRVVREMQDMLKQAAGDKELAPRLLKQIAVQKVLVADPGD